MKFLRIREWDRLQHYKHRSPPWIKLYRDFLRSQAWVTGDDATRTLAIACMMLAAENDNLIPFDPVYVQRAAYLNQPPNFDQLIASGFLELIEDTASASALLASCLRDASNSHTNALPEKSREETEKSDSREEKSTRSQFNCVLCKGTGLKNSKAHPGRQTFCGCPTGFMLQRHQQSEQRGVVV